MIEIIVAIVTGVAAIVGVVLTNMASNRRVSSQIEKLEKHDEEQYLSLLRLTVMSQDMPISERIIAGKLYVDKGGNGAVREYYEQLLEEHTK